MSRSPELMKIGAFAKHAGTNLRTLRYYEELGLLVPAERSSGGFRYYRPADLNRVRLIGALQELGLALDEIRELLDLRQHIDDREEWIRRVRAALDRHAQLIDERIRVLQAQQHSVAAARAKLGDCSPCPYCPAATNNHCDPCQNTGQRLPEFLSALY